MAAPRPMSPMADLATCLVFFTRLPLPHFGARGRTLGDAIWAAPGAGLIVAITGGFAFTLARMLDIPSLPATAVALAVAVIATGCLHEDGLSDTADGFGGGKTLDRKLEIMRDSRLGTYGAAALLFSILLRWSALATLHDGADVICALIAAHVGSRGIFGYLIQKTPLARDSGLAGSVGVVSDSVARTGLALGAAGLLFLGIGGAIAAAVVLAIVLLAFRALCLRQIGGITGDTLGAAQQLAEITILLAASAVFF